MFLSRKIFEKLAFSHYMRTGEVLEYTGYLIYYFENKFSRRKRARLRRLASKALNRGEVKSFDSFGDEDYDSDEAFEELMAEIANSEEGEPCDACKAIDGHEFPADQIPPEPHPNCRCEITIVHEDGTKTDGVPTPYKDSQDEKRERSGCARVSSKFGLRTHPKTGDVTHHDGIDIAAPEGTEILSPIEGEVIRSGAHREDMTKGYGYFAEIRLEDGSSAIFGHMVKPSTLSVGDKVGYHDHIGYVGSTGSSSGNHLHYERRDENGEVEEPNEDEIEDLLDTLDESCTPDEEKEE